MEKMGNIQNLGRMKNQDVLPDQKLVFDSVMLYSDYVGHRLIICTGQFALDNLVGLVGGVNVDDEAGKSPK